MFIEILLWYLLGLIISFVLIGFINTKYPTANIPLLYFLSWVGLLIIILISLAFAIGEFMEWLENKEYLKYLRPEEVFNLIKTKYHASKK